MNSFIKTKSKRVTIFPQKERVMKKVMPAVFSVLFTTSFVYAHLCNDVFIQAKDNLAVKVDIRDNQLRVNKSAEFRVYLLNTMDRDIANIQLAVESDDFDAVVKPAPDWTSFPELETKNKGGKKEYFIVRLNRKPATEEGRYKIGLTLYNGENKNMVFKTMDIKDAIVDMQIPLKSAELNIDGQVNKNEWDTAFLCTSFYEYKHESVFGLPWLKSQGVNKVSQVQTRCRFSRDENNLYCMADFQTEKNDDTINIHIAKDTDSVPEIISINLQQKKVSFSKPSPGITAHFSGTKAEIAIPLALLDLKGAGSFYVNITRKQDNTQTYWRGNDVSVNDPIVYANFILK